VATKVLRTVDHNFDLGTPVYRDEWDVLVVLDACRADMLANVSDEWPFIPDPVPTRHSVASYSASWMKRNFTKEFADEMERTAHITGNPYSDQYLDSESFLLLDEVWQYAWDDGLGTIPPRSITDRTINIAREHQPDRMIVHYLQPHFPSIPDPLDSGIDIGQFDEGWRSIWDRLNEGEISPGRVWESSLANLRYVLEEVDLLLESIDADTVVVTADHGNAFGEWYQFGHPPNLPIRALRKVPWVKTTATDTEEYQPPKRPEEREATASEVEHRLRDLGYI